MCCVAARCPKTRKTPCTHGVELGLLWFHRCLAAMSYRANHKTADAHSDSVWSAVWAGEDRIVTGSVDETVKTWAVGADGIVAGSTMEGHELGVVSVDVNSDCSLIATSSMDCRIRLWDMDTAKTKTVIDAGPVETWTACFNPKRPQLASGSQSGNVNLWDVESGKQLGSIATRGKFVMSVQYSPDGKRVACGAHDGVVSLWDLETSTILSKLEAHAMTVRSLAFSPDGNVLYSASDDGRVNAHDVSSASAHSASLVHSFSGHLSWVLAVDVSHDGTQLVTGSSDKRVKLWDTRSKEALQTFDSHTDQVWDVAFNSTGSHFCSVGDDKVLQVYTKQ